jgi:hypothetical protein
MKLVWNAVVVINLLVLSGCQTLGIGVDPWMRAEKRFTLAGTNNLINSEHFEMVDLIQAVDPMQLRDSTSFKRRWIDKGEWVDNPDTPQDDRYAAKHRDAFERALYAFHLTDYDAFGTAADRRNRILDRLLAASEARCGAYKQYLRNFESTYETGFGIATTVLGSAGAIATGALNTRAFAGLAAMSSGAKAEIRQGVFSNVATHVLVPGIDTRRAQILKEIGKFRELDISKYTLQGALHDAAKYHGACSLAIGLDAAQDAIRTFDNPGLAQANRTLRLLSEQAQLMSLYDKAQRGELTADNAKVIKVNYEPSVITLIGSANENSAANDKPMSAATLETALTGLTVMARASAAALKELAAKETDATKKSVIERRETCIRAFLKESGKVCDASFKVTDITTIPDAQEAVEKAFLKMMADLAPRRSCVDLTLAKVDAEKADKDYAKKIAAAKAIKGAVDAFAKHVAALTDAQVIASLAELKKLFAVDPLKADGDGDKINKGLAKLKSVTYPETKDALGDVGKCL